MQLGKIIYPSLAQKQHVADELRENFAFNNDKVPYFKCVQVPQHIKLYCRL